MRKMFLVSALALFIAAGLCRAESVTAKGDISNVIVYRGQALVTRTISAELPKGASELVIADLPERIVSESLYCEGPGDVTILSVRYREKEHREDKRKEVRDVDAQIETIQRDIHHAARNHQHASSQHDRFASLWQLAVDGANVDLKRGVIDPEPLEKYIDYLAEKADQWHAELVRLEDEKADLEKQLKELERRREDLRRGHSQVQREAVVYLDKKDGRKAELQLSYLVTGANWSPQYNLRAQPNDGLALIEYNAVIHQSSGENWQNTNIALSTAQPSLVAAAPLLEPMKIRLGMGPVEISNRRRIASDMISANESEKSLGLEQKTESYSYLDQTQSFEDLVRARRDNIKGGRMSQSALNSFALSNQIMELNATRDMVQRMKSQVAVIERTEGVSVLYRLPGRLSLPSKSEQQMVQIARVDAPAEYTLLATPLLTDYVYLQADVTNQSDTIFLPGPASAYRNGEFVGTSNMELVTSGQTFTAGFGIDSQVQVVREFTDKKSETLWGNRIDEHSYRIEISNYKDTGAKLRLLERLPYTEDEQVEITLSDPSHPLSEDAKYLRIQRKKGILRWDIELPPTTTGEKATVLTYGFTMKYDNDMHIEAVRADS